MTQLQRNNLIRMLEQTERLLEGLIAVTDKPRRNKAVCRLAQLDQRLAELRELKNLGLTN